MTTLITGAGLVGTSFAQWAAKRSEPLIFLDPEPRTEFLRFKLGTSDYRLVQGNVRNLPDLLDAIREHRVETIVHTAGMIGGRVDQALYAAFFTNLGGTLNVAEAVRLSGVKRLVHISTLGVYDWRRPMSGPPKEDFPRGEGRGYGNFKVAKELILEAYQRRYGFELIMLRLGLVFGLGHFWSGSSGGEKMQDLLEAAAHATIARPRAADMAANEYVYAKDIGRAIDLAATVPMPQETIFNIGSGELVQFGTVIETLRKLVPSLTVEIEQGKPGESHAYAMDIARAKQHLHWEPRYSLESGIEDYLSELKTVNGSAKVKMRA
jgi:nucleoside-diphosphate-sugar epimerase